MYIYHILIISSLVPSFADFRVTLLIILPQRWGLAWVWGQLWLHSAFQARSVGLRPCFNKPVLKGIRIRSFMFTQSWRWHVAFRVPVALGVWLQLLCLPVKTTLGLYFWWTLSFPCSAGPPGLGLMVIGPEGHWCTKNAGEKRKLIGVVCCYCLLLVLFLVVVCCWCCLLLVVFVVWFWLFLLFVVYFGCFSLGVSFRGLASFYAFVFNFSFEEEASDPASLILCNWFFWPGLSSRLPFFPAVLCFCGSLAMFKLSNLWWRLTQVCFPRFVKFWAQHFFSNNVSVFSYLSTPIWMYKPC